MNDEYVPVPVAAAKEIADNFGKAVVVIIAWDREHSLIHTTTYGETDLEKKSAAMLGDIFATQVSDISKARTFEDLPPSLRPASCCGHRAACPNKES